MIRHFTTQPAGGPETCAANPDYPYMIILAGLLRSPGNKSFFGGIAALFPLFNGTFAAHYCCKTANPHL